MSKGEVKVPKFFLVPWEPPEHGCLKKWRKRIQRAVDRGHFTVSDQLAASDWSLCACGEAFSYFDGMVAYEKNRPPHNFSLEQLGLEFSVAVAAPYINGDTGKTERGGSPKSALKILRRIEKQLVLMDKTFRRRHRVALKAWHKGNSVPMEDLFAAIGRSWCDIRDNLPLSLTVNNYQATTD
jgi:hypothetical protein